MRSPSTRASTIGARRLTASARSISSTLNVDSWPDAGSARVGDEHVDVRALARQALHRVGVGEVDRQRARRRLGGQRLEDLGAPPGEHELGAGRAQAARDGVAEPTGRAGEQNAAALPGSRREDCHSGGEPVQEGIAAHRADLTGGEEPGRRARPRAPRRRVRVVVGHAEHRLAAPVAA